jgi:hypothetical protein
MKAIKRLEGPHAEFEEKGSSRSKEGVESLVDRYWEA